jgi:hypothetical protein
MGIKLTRSAIQAILSLGTVKGPNVTIPIAALEACESASRVRAADKGPMFEAILAAHPPDAAGMRKIPAAAWEASGFPSTYFANASVWSGVAEAANLAAEHGLVGKIKHVLLPGGAVDLFVQLTPQTPKDVERRAKALAKRAAKASPASTSTAPSDSGSAEPATDTDTDTDADVIDSDDGDDTAGDSSDE